MQFWAYIAAGLVAGILGRLFFKMIFADRDDLWDCVVKSFTPDIFSLFKGELFEDMKQSFKLTLFLILVIGSTWVTYDYVKGLGEDEKMDEENIPASGGTHEGFQLRQGHHTGE